MKKAFKIMKKVVLGIILVVYFVFVIAMTLLLLNFNDYGVTEFGNKSLLIIRDKISNENYKMGDLLVVESMKLDEIKEGQEIFVYRVEHNGSVSIDVGNVDKTYKDENAISFQNGATYSMDFVVGKNTKTYNNIGKYLAIIESKWGFLFIVLVPCFLIFVYQIYNLIIEIKYNKNDELEEE